MFIFDCYSKWYLKIITLFLIAEWMNINSELLSYKRKNTTHYQFLFSNKKKYTIMALHFVQNMNIFCEYEHQNSSFNF